VIDPAEKQQLIMGKALCGNRLLWTITRQLNVHRWTDTFTGPVLALIARSPAFPLLPGFAKPGLDPRDAATAVAGAERGQSAHSEGSKPGRD